MNFPIDKHPFYGCDTGYKIIQELSKVLRDTGYMVLLPANAEHEKRKYYIACTNKVKSDETNNRFVVFVGDKYAVAAVNSLKPNLERTNWNLYGDKFLEQLQTSKDEIIAGKVAITISYSENLVIPRLQFVKVSIQLDIK